MKNYQWVPVVVIVGALILFSNHQRGIRQSGFDEGIDCIIEGTNRDEGSTPKMCINYYSDNIKKLTELIEKPEDSKHRQIVKPILQRTLGEWYYLKENGAGNLIWKRN